MPVNAPSELTAPTDSEGVRRRGDSGSEAHCGRPRRPVAEMAALAAASSPTPRWDYRSAAPCAR
jgi:hypothetical protein